MNRKDYPIIKTNKSFKQMSEGEKVFVSVSKSGFSQTALCQFIAVEKGLVVAKVLEHYFPRGHSPFNELSEGSKIRKRAKCFFLWYESENAAWPSYHWFKSLDEPVQ